MATLVKNTLSFKICPKKLKRLILFTWSYIVAKNFSGKKYLPRHRDKILLNFDFHLRILIKPEAKVPSLTYLWRICAIMQNHILLKIYFQIVWRHSRPIKPSSSAYEDSLNVRNAEYGLKLAFDDTRSCVSFMTILLEKFTCFFILFGWTWPYLFLVI